MNGKTSESGLGNVEGALDVTLGRHAVAELVARDRIEHQGLDHGPGTHDRQRPVEHRHQCFDGRRVIALRESNGSEGRLRLTELVVPFGQAGDRSSRTGHVAHA